MTVLGETTMSYPLFARCLSLWLVISLTACTGAAEPATEAQSACPQPTVKVELTATEVNLFTWPEYVPEEIIDCFQTVYGIEVNQDLFSSPEEMYAKVARGATGYDLIQPPDYMVALLIKQGLLAPLDHAQLPVLDHFAPQYRNPAFDLGNQYTLPYQSGSSAIAYRADKVTPPTAYADLWKAEYANRLVMLDDSRTIIGATLLTLGYDVNTSDPTELSAAKAKLLELTPNVRLFDSDSPKTALIGGDADLGIIWSGEAALAQAENDQIAYLYPSEGPILFQDNFAILADAPNADAAYAWLNYLYQPDVFWQVMRDYPFTNPHVASLAWAKEHQPEVYNTYMASNITNIPEAVLQKGHWLHDLGDATPLYDQIWTESKGQ
jgi:spermidine/putrescine-binding protein